MIKTESKSNTIRPEEKTSLVPHFAFQPGLARMQQTMNEMFNDLFSGFGMPRWSGLPQPSVWMPALDLYQQNNMLIAECAVPGMKKDDIKITVTADSLVIEGEFKRQEVKKADNYYHSELESGSLYRKIALPVQIKTDEVKAMVENGILKVTMPAAEKMQSKVTVPVS